MLSWQEDLLEAVDTLSCEHALFQRIGAAARSLGFEHCAYGLRLPLPFSNPRTVMLNDYPQAWQQRYREQGYLSCDPTVAHARHSQAPIVWTDATFAAAPALWREAREHGLVVGWAQSNLTANGVGGMLTLARSAEPLGEAELQAGETKMRWLVSLAHAALSRILTPRVSGFADEALTGREIEVLKWTADGKTSNEISTILSVSENTVNFHVKNAICKMQTSNKTSAVVRAAMLGLLN